MSGRDLARGLVNQNLELSGNLEFQRRSLLRATNERSPLGLSPAGPFASAVLLQNRSLDSVVAEREPPVGSPAVSEPSVGPAFHGKVDQAQAHHEEQDSLKDGQEESDETER